MNNSNYAGNEGDVSGGQNDAPKSTYASGALNPQNDYRSLDGNGAPFSGSRAEYKSTPGRRTHQGNISVANGGKPGFDMIGTTGDYVGDGK